MAGFGKTLQRHAPTLAALITRLRDGRQEWLPPRIVYAQPGLHHHILQRFDGKAPGTFLEVGANDGLAQSNTAYLEKYLGWHGVLVEPLPTKFAQCVMNRPGAKVFNAALVAPDFGLSTIEIAYSNLMSVVEDRRNKLADGDHVEKGRQFLGAEEKLAGHRFIVPAKTVTAVLEAAGSPKIDFFSLDVEGYEFELLKGLDFSRFRPRLFLIETREKEGLDAVMRENGYVCTGAWSEHDYVYEDGAR